MFFFSSRRRHTRFDCDWSSDVCSSDLHAPSLETQYLADGRMTNRRLVMYNDFVIVGPEADPARIAGERSVVAALRRIAGRSEERRVGKECRSRWSPDH